MNSTATTLTRQEFDLARAALLNAIDERRTAADRIECSVCRERARERDRSEVKALQSVLRKVEGLVVDA